MGKGKILILGQICIIGQSEDYITWRWAIL
jgi:hypothetical protein